MSQVETTAARRCGKCQREQRDGDRYCPGCGRGPMPGQILFVALLAAALIAAGAVWSLACDAGDRFNQSLATGLLVIGILNLGLIWEWRYTGR
jgi:hypothetical protein